MKLSRTTKLCLTLATVCALLVLRTGCDGPAPSPAPARSAGATTDAGAESEATRTRRHAGDTEAAPATAPSVERAKVHPPAALNGKVTAAFGERAPNATLRLEFTDPAAGAPRTTTTDADGQFRFDDVPGDEPFVLVCTAPTFPEVRRDEPGLLHGRPRTVAMRLVRTTAVEGELPFALADSDVPTLSARIAETSAPRPTWTGARFRSEGVQPGPQTLLARVQRADETRVAWTTIDVRNGETNEAGVLTTGGASLSVVCRSDGIDATTFRLCLGIAVHGGEPADLPELSLTVESGPGRVHRVTGLPRGKAVVTGFLLLDAPGLDRVMVPTELADGEQTVVLDFGRTVRRGQIEFTPSRPAGAADGMPHMTCVVERLPDDAGGATRIATVEPTSPDALHSVSVDPGRYRLRVLVPGLEAVSRPLTVVAHGTVTATLPGWAPSASLRGSVERTDGGSMDRVQVELVAKCDDPLMPLRMITRCEIAASGEFVLDGMVTAQGTWLAVRTGDGGLWELPIRPDAEGRVRLVLD